MKSIKKNFIINISTLHLAVLFFMSALTTNSIAENAWQNNPSKLACSPRVLHSNDTLTLTLGSMHGSELAIMRKSDGIAYFLVVGSPPSNMTPLMTTTEFSKAKEVKISAKTEAFPWVAEASKEAIFTRSGTYTIQVSNNLESDEGGYICNIKYLAK